jgi:diguanylate cyclase (GGDEF)-like protein
MGDAANDMVREALDAFIDGDDGRAARVLERDSHVDALYVDLDNFKRVNDRHGHNAGDDVLKQIADALRACVRVGDLVARLGGDEFAIAMWDCEGSTPTPVSQRIREAVDAVGAQYPDTGLGASIGSTPLDGVGSVDDAIRRADEAMYSVKAERKKRG